MNMCKLYATMHDVTASLQAFDGLGEDFMVFSMLWCFLLHVSFVFLTSDMAGLDFAISGHDCSCRAS